eukprot:824750-Pelagomonas_calceolata.AAC.4
MMRVLHNVFSCSPPSAPVGLVRVPHNVCSVTKCNVVEVQGQKDQAKAGGRMPQWHLPTPILRNKWACTASFWPSAHSARYDLVVLLLHLFLHLS